MRAIRTLQLGVHKLLLHGNVTVGLSSVVTDEVSHSGLPGGALAVCSGLEVRGAAHLPHGGRRGELLLRCY